LSDFTENFRTNFEPFELKRLVDLTQAITADSVYTFSLEPQANIVCNSSLIIGYEDPVTAEEQQDDQTPTEQPSVDDTDTDSEETAAEDTGPIPIRLYVVEPCLGKTLADVHELVRNGPLIAKLKKESAALEIQNSTGKSGLANQTFGYLSEFGVQIQFTTYQGSEPYAQTIFYDNSKGSKPNTLNYLKNNFTMVASDVGYPSSTADFFIVMGNDDL
jgi:hypothetical protein